MDWRAAALVAFLVLIVFMIVYRSQCGAPEFQHGDPVCAHPTVDTSWQVRRDTPIRPGTLFVSVPSYRDEECRDTIWEMYDKASDPERVFTGVVQQNKYEKEDCFDKCPDCKARKDSGHIRVKNFDFREARGPCFARYEASKLWDGEEYFMEIDSHTKFVQGWDRILFDQLGATGDPKAIIAGYPPTDEQLQEIVKGRRQFPFMCKVDFNEDGLPLATAQMVDVPKDGKPVPGAYAGANLMVMPYQALYDVPFDPYLNFLFWGEELLHSARLWTSGYNFYAPVEVFASHHYDADSTSKRPKFWDDLKGFKACKGKAVQRAKAILDLGPSDKLDPEYEPELEMYGLGSARPITEYWQLLGADVGTKKAKHQCDNLNAYKL